jgi:serine/alanine adding enzyme
MSTSIYVFDEDDSKSWNEYVLKHPQGTVYHLLEWKKIIEKTYGHSTYYLVAIQSNISNYSVTSSPRSESERSIAGILPLVHLKHFLFGNRLVSMPFFDMGGILANDEQTENLLLAEAVKVGRRLKACSIELRHVRPLGFSQNGASAVFADSSATSSPLLCLTKSHKVRMVVDLPGNPEALMTSFKSKLRSQIKKPLRGGLISKFGGQELLEDFYKVFAHNMRDLGSPVHSKELMRNVLQEFGGQARIVAIYQDSKALAASLVIGFRDTLENPWAASLRSWSSLAPNMLLYWKMLEHACEGGFAHFDFGRSSPGEGTHKFKEQWGAHSTSLHWDYVSLNGIPGPEPATEKERFARAIRYWRKLPIPVTRLIGPLIRKHIAL